MGSSYPTPLTAGNSTGNSGAGTAGPGHIVARTGP